jgi:hypothetical protein
MPSCAWSGKGFDWAGRMEGLGCRIAEEPLRRWILEAYQKNKKAGGVAEKVLSAIRQYLSGPPGSESAFGSYWFEDDPDGATRQLLDELDSAVPGLARSACKPVLEKLQAARASKRRKPFPDPDAAVSERSSPHDPAAASPHDPAAVPPDETPLDIPHEPAPVLPDVHALAAGIGVLGKPLACAVISTVLLGLSRIGLEPFEQALARTP